jgi:hypothetical protein
MEPVPIRRHQTPSAVTKPHRRDTAACFGFQLTGTDHLAWPARRVGDDHATPMMKAIEVLDDQRARLSRARE